MNTQTRQNKFLLTFGIVWGMFSLIFVLLGVRSLKLEHQFDAESVTVPGVITSKRVDEKWGIDRDTKQQKVTRTFYLKYKFSDEGQEKEAESSVSSSKWESTHEQDRIQVQYLPSDTTKSRIAGESQKMGTYVFTGIGSVGVLIGMASIFFHFRKGK